MTFLRAGKKVSCPGSTFISSLGAVILEFFSLFFDLLFAIALKMKLTYTLTVKLVNIWRRIVIQFFFQFFPATYNRA
jgi:hypothetical protein